MTSEFFSKTLKAKKQNAHQQAFIHEILIQYT